MAIANFCFAYFAAPAVRNKANSLYIHATHKHKNQGNTIAYTHRNINQSGNYEQIAI